MNKILKDAFVILSYPKSGSNLVKALVQEQFGVSVTDDLEEWLGGESHGLKIHEWRVEIPPDTPLIFVLRNYKECIPSWNKFKGRALTADAFCQTYAAGNILSNDYMGQCMCFLAHAGKKILLYHEDNLMDKKRVVAACSSLPCFEKKKLMSSEKAEEVAARELEDRKTLGDVHGSGMDLFFHSRQIPKSVRKEIDSRLRAKYPVLYRLMFSKYYEGAP